MLQTRTSVVDRRQVAAIVQWLSCRISGMFFRPAAAVLR